MVMMVAPPPDMSGLYGGTNARGGAPVSVLVTVTISRRIRGLLERRFRWVSRGAAAPRIADHDELRTKMAWAGPPTDGHRFLSVFMDQNNKCNLRCQMCGFSDPRVDGLGRYDMPWSLFESMARQVFPRTNYTCLSILTEPFMTADFPDRLLLVRELGVPFVDVITNGTLLTERSIAKVLDAQISRLVFSVDGGTKEVFERIRVGARFETVVKNIRLFEEMKRERGLNRPLVRLNHVLSELNIDHFQEFLALVESLAPAEIAVRTVSRMSDAIVQQSEDPAFWEKVRRIKRELIAFCARTGIVDSGYLRDQPSPIDLFTDQGERIICRLAWDTLAIHPNGDVFPCMAWARPAIGNFQRQTFDEIWSAPAWQALRDEFTTKQPGVDCLHCSIRKPPTDTNDDFFYRKVAKPYEVGA
jgi:radical SAM protein with 4Fe4S-binding SPASM domain